MDNEKNTENDLGLKNEVSFAIANLIQLEEHLSITIAQTKNESVLSILNEVRALRAKYMKQMIGQKELQGQLWCSLKHTLSSAYRLIEVGVKYTILGNNKEAIECFIDAKELFQLSVILIEVDNGING